MSQAHNEEALSSIVGDESLDFLIPGNIQSRLHLTILLPHMNGSISSKWAQHDLQKCLDDNLKFTIERKCQSLRDQARLKAILSPH